jgi:hypothetical protein
MKDDICDHNWVEQNGVWTDGDYICTKCEARMEKCPRTGKMEIYGGKFICNEHPSYKGVYKPRINCKKCWEIYDERRSKTSNSGS